MEIIKNYRKEDTYRASFNALAGKVFCLDFENWYQNGFWNDKYSPYSIVEDGKIIANVSVNRCDMKWNGKVYHLLQLGTVMTDPDYRGRGYSRILMEEIQKDYKDQCDGMYLYANDSVLEFYPKFGFRKCLEYQYSKEVSVENDAYIEKVPMDTPKDWANMVSVLNSYQQVGEYVMVNNSDLFMFYLSQFMTENVFYIAKSDTYVVGEVEDHVLTINGVWSKKNVTLDEVIEAFGKEITRVVLSLTPEDPSGYEVKEARFDDTTLFVKGKAFDEINSHKFMFQEITHA